MTEMKIYSLFDVKVGAFWQPFFSRNNETAIRAVGDGAQQPNNPLGAHPEDYVLHELGHWNDETGSINGYPPIVVTTVAAILSGERG